MHTVLKSLEEGHDRNLPNEHKDWKAKAWVATYVTCLSKTVFVTSLFPTNLFVSASLQYLKKLHTQERAVEEVKLAIKPYYQKKEITKEEYKDILRKAVHKVRRDVCWGQGRFGSRGHKGKVLTPHSFSAPV